MTDIKEYIKRNASAFGTAEPPEGHEGRFEAKLDALLSVAESSGREERKRRKTRMGIFSVLTLLPQPPSPLSYSSTVRKGRLTGSPAWQMIPCRCI